MRQIKWKEGKKKQKQETKLSKKLCEEVTSLKLEHFSLVFPFGRQLHAFETSPLFSQSSYNNRSIFSNLLKFHLSIKSMILKMFVNTI